MSYNLSQHEPEALRNFYNSVVGKLQHCRGITCLDKIDHLIKLAKENGDLRAAIRRKNRELEDLSNAISVARHPIVVHDSTTV